MTSVLVRSARGIAAGVLCVTLLIVGTDAVMADVSSPSPAAAVTPAVAPSGAANALDGFARAWAAIAAYSATVTVFEQKGTVTQNVVFDYAFRKPAIATVREDKGPNAGVTLTWNGGTTVDARRSGFLHLFKKTLSLHDALATTIRGSSIDELSFGAILAHAQAAAGTLSEAPGEVIDGVTTNAVTLIPTASAGDAGLTREVLELSPTTHLPVRVLGYAGAMLVRKIDFSNVTIASGH